MDGVISNFRMGRHRQKTNQMVIKPSDADNLETARKFIGKGVIWKSPAGKEIKGTITKEHGRKGFVRVLFEKGMPGQAIGTKVEIS